MTSTILNAITQGFTARQVVSHIARNHPKYANAIYSAQAAGYTAQQIARKLSGEESTDDSDDRYLTEHEQVQKRDAKQKKAAALGLVGALGTAGAAAAGAYSLATRNRAIQPSAILPPLPQQQTQRALPGPQQRPGLPPPSAGSSRPPRGPQPTPHTQPPSTFGPTTSPKGKPINVAAGPFMPTASAVTPQQSVDLVRNIKEDTRITNVLQGVGDAAIAAEILRKVMPRDKLAVLEKTEGGLDKIVQDYAQHLKEYQPQQPPAIRQQGAPPIIEQSGQPPSIEEAKAQSQIEPEEATEFSSERPITPHISIRERTQQAAFAERPELKRIVDASFKGKEFNLPTYQLPNESKEEFGNRKIINEAIKKAAEELKKGKSFLDFGPLPPEILDEGGPSTAEDVLRFMAGIPNVYDPLLDEDEKQELYDGLMEGGQLSVEGLRPGEGERNIHGAQMTPNMVWNLLLVLEPRLYKMERPKAIKGAKKPGQKMDSAGFRRYLTHNVYGALSGKTISNNLAETIGTISNIAHSLDVVSKSATDGNFNKVFSELEKMADTKFFNLFTDEVEDMARAARGKKVTPKSAADTRAATEIKKKVGGNENRRTETTHSRKAEPPNKGTA